MPRHKSRAFVLGAADYRETSKLLHLFCENEGRISVIARGMRSPKGNKAQLADGFNLLQVNYTLKDGATLGMLTGVEPERVYSALRTNLLSYALASYWFDTLKVAGQSRLASHDVFKLTDNFLQSLQQGSGATATVPGAALQLLLDFAQELGFALQLLPCGVCNTNIDVRRFSVASGIAVCSKCQPPVGRALVVSEVLRTALQQQPASWPINAAGEFLNLYNEFLTTHLDHRLATFGFLKGLLR